MGAPRDLKSSGPELEPGCQVRAESLAGKRARTASCSAARGRPLWVTGIPIFLALRVPVPRKVLTFIEKHGVPGDSFWSACGRRKLGCRVTSDFPLPPSAEPAQIPRDWDGPKGCVSTLLPIWATRLPGVRADSSAVAVRTAPGPENDRVSAKGRGEGWPSKPARESPAMSAVPTHLAREIVARTAGQGVLGGLANLGGSGARRARHVPGREVIWGQRRARDSSETTPPWAPPTPSPSTAPAGTPTGSSLPPATPTTPAPSRL